MLTMLILPYTFPSLFFFPSALSVLSAPNHHTTTTTTTGYYSESIAREGLARQDTTEDAVTSVGGQEVALDVPKIVSAEAAGAASSNSNQITGLFGGSFFGTQEEEVKSHRLEVQIFTTDIDKGGTEDSIFIYVIGDKSTEGPITLSKDLLSKDNMTSGR